MEYTVEQLEAMEPSQLREIAISKSSNDNRFKKTIHGKNKKTMIDFIKQSEAKPNSNNELFVALQKLSKENLIAHCQKFTDYKKSYERKCKEFQVEFLISKNFDINNNEVSPEIIKLKKLMSFKKADLMNHLRKKEIFKPSFERKDKEELAKMLLDEDIENIVTANSSDNTHPTDYSKKSLRELKDLAMNNPLYNSKTFGKSKNQLIHFLQNHAHSKDEIKEEEEEEDCSSPINILEFMVKPDPELIKEALTKILTSNK